MHQHFSSCYYPVEVREPSTVAKKTTNSPINSSAWKQAPSSPQKEKRAGNCKAFVAGSTERFRLGLVCLSFMKDSLPIDRSLVSKNSHEEHMISVLKWVGNFPDINPFKNDWNHMKKSTGIMTEQHQQSARGLREALNNHGHLACECH